MYLATHTIVTLYEARQLTIKIAGENIHNYFVRFLPGNQWECVVDGPPTLRLVRSVDITSFST